MDVTVLLSSGDEEIWPSAAGAVNDSGLLVVIYQIEEDVSGDVKTLAVTREIEQPGREGVLEVPPPMIKTEVFEVAAEYAPGMWMRVKYERD